MREYRPRRCSKRWLDGDCPEGVLCIFYHPKETDPYDIFFAEPHGHAEPWLDYLCSDADGMHYHGEMQAHKLAEYRYRMKHYYARWSDLPEVVKNLVRKDLS